MQSNAVTCPKCYKKIPPEPEMSKHRSNSGENRQTRQERPKRESGHSREPRQKTERVYNRRTALFLNAIPGFFGIVGLGQIYRDHRSLLGYMLLLSGLVLFSSSMMLLMHWTPSFLVNLFSSLSAFPLMLLYALIYLFGLLDLVLGQFIHFNPKY